MAISPPSGQPKPGAAPEAVPAATQPAATAQVPTTKSKLSILDPLKIPNYRWYFIVGLGISGAFGMQNLAFSWLMYELTGQPALVGLNLVAMAVPQILLGFVGGVVADRISKRTIM